MGIIVDIYYSMMENKRSREKKQKVFEIIRISFYPFIFNVFHLTVAKLYLKVNSASEFKSRFLLILMKCVQPFQSQTCQQF
jgi:hypothetical protein